MSQFNGGKNKVRCVDCKLLSGNLCQSKGVGVAPKKHRICAAYQFKGEYKNREPLAGIYVPQIDKSTQRLIRKMVELGIINVNDAGVPVQKQVVEMPRTTATAQNLGIRGDDQVGLAGPDLSTTQGSVFEPPDSDRS